MKTKNFKLFISLLTFIIIVPFCSSCSNPGKQKVDNLIHLSKNNQSSKLSNDYLSFDDEDIYRDVKFTYKNAKKSNNNHCTLAKDGFITCDFSKHTLSVTASFTGTASLFTGFNQNELIYEYPLNSGEKTDICGTFFSFVATSELSLAELKIEYSPVELSNSHSLSYSYTNDGLEVIRCSNCDFKYTAPQYTHVIFDSGTTRYEVENSNYTDWQISSDNPSKVVSRSDASEGKFLASASGAKVGASTTYNVDFKVPCKVYIAGSFSQTENKKRNNQNLKDTYTMIADENKNIFYDTNNILYARSDITQWDLISHQQQTFSSGLHSFKVSVASNTGTGCPNIDYYQFVSEKIDDPGPEPRQVPDNDFHNYVQYAYNNDAYDSILTYAQGAIEYSIPDGVLFDFSGDTSVPSSSSYVVKYADNSDLINAKFITNLSQRNARLKNVKRGETIYWKASPSDTHYFEDKILHLMNVTWSGPRTLEVEGLSNVRDIGGYESSLVNGARIKQGLYYRGAKINNITEKGKITLRDELGVRMEIDMRDTAQCTGPYIDGISYSGTNASIPSGTESTRWEGFASQYKYIFGKMAAADTNPIYLHCTAGADRTGIMSFFLLGLCGASYEDMARDYNYTNFSTQGARYLENEFVNWYNKLLTNYPSETLPNKFKAHLMTKGLSSNTLETIRGIFVEGYTPVIN